MKHIFNIVVLVLLILNLSSCAKSGPKPRGEKALLPNTAVFNYSINTVWENLLRVLKYDLLYEMAVENEKDHFFATTLIRDYQEGRQIKYRLSGTLKFDGSGVVVVIYGQVQTKNNGNWVLRESNMDLERSILARLRERLPKRR